MNEFYDDTLLNYAGQKRNGPLPEIVNNNSSFVDNKSGIASNSGACSNNPGVGAGGRTTSPSRT